MKYLLSLLLWVTGVHAQHSKLKINHLSGNIYIYTTYKLFSGSLFPSNSLYMVTDDGVVLIDTPWDEAQFEPLLDSIKKRHSKNVVLCIVTHYHDDRTAGLEFFRKRGIATYSSKPTYDLCAEYKEKQAAHYFTKDTTFTVGGYKIDTFYPGEGHTKDNITVWFAKDKVLYGGCLVKSVENNSLGYIGDANLEAWDDTIETLLEKYPRIAYVIPGHFGWSKGRKSLKHTIKLLRKHEED
ncbi:BlaB/IND/MUS family subclass B1 metallo-beta-lactamase [Flavobacterium salilacus subsp. salilacus]|uniref:BlaB/IND/MUS family subclass B1 metallo-beta-lactamase n=1 Tax=Flavobacterium TaxID=237 RepID=UPI0010751B01|nr:MULTISPECIES: BlaB/IND/MUS family subclass B1 metallo-beta-lactamase [Flavobacterium]KAF2519403.1 BlaB/IND/MUS family subclass B1 metallo-beta-lactamase [Flavobacterium salilacus subsp. salilacus]MBE1614705.1 BlaB/IND/MUS family subclass B1 metallo-beta-lactamase [Flavobacterium sp. SaA2.13]